MGASPSSDANSGNTDANEASNESGQLFDQLMDIFIEEANEAESMEVLNQNTKFTASGENPEEQFYEGVQQLHIARGENNILDVLLWLAVLQECSQEAEGEDCSLNSDAALVIHEILEDCERMVLLEVKSIVANIYEERKHKNNKKLKSFELQQIKNACDKVGLKVSILVETKDDSNGADLSGVSDEKKKIGGNKFNKTYSSGMNQKDKEVDNDETPSLKKRENALSSLSDTCQLAVSSLLEDDAKQASEVFQTVRHLFDRCIMLGAHEKAIATYGKALRKGLMKAMDDAIKPLDMRASTRKQLSTMKQETSYMAQQRRTKDDIESSKSSLIEHTGDGEDNISMDDNDDPQPHVASMTRVLSRASIVLAEVRYTSFRCHKEMSSSPSNQQHAPKTADESVKNDKFSPNKSENENERESAELAELLGVIAKDASTRACKVLKHFREEWKLEDTQMKAVDFVNSGMEFGAASSSSSSSSSSSQYQEGSSSLSLDPVKLNSLLVDLSELSAFCQRFMTFLKASGGINLSPSTVSDLPLFVDSLQLASSYVDIETAYCFFNIKKSLLEAETLEASCEVHISSIAEDVFFVIRDKSLERALSSLSEQSILAICSRVVETLEVQAPEPSLYLAVSRLPKKACEVSLTTRAVESYKVYKRQQLEGIKNKKREAEEGDGSIISSSSNANSSGASPPSSQRGESSSHADKTERLENILKGFSDHLSDLSLGIDDEEVASLLSLIIATNTADACAASIILLQEFIIEVLDEVGMSDKFIDKVAQSSVGDLARISKSYTQLRGQFIERLLEEHLGHNFNRFRAKIRHRSFDIEKQSQIESKSNSNSRKKVIEKSESGGFISGFLSSSLSGNSVADSTPQPTLSLTELCEKYILDEFTFHSMTRRLTSECLLVLLELVVSKINGIICSLFFSSDKDNIRTVSEWGAITLQAEVRELEKLLSGYLSEGASSLSSCFAKLDTIVLLLNLDRPSDIAFYPIHEEAITSGELRHVLACRFGWESAAQVKLPF